MADDDIIVLDLELLRELVERLTPEWEVARELANAIGTIPLPPLFGRQRADRGPAPYLRRRADAGS
jgi:hypothetical protein